VIDRKALLKALQKQAKLLEASLRERLKETPDRAAALEAEHAAAKSEGRTADPFTTWLDLHLDQVASSWVLATVFVRFLEDNQLVSPPRLAGPGDALVRARDEETLFFRKHPELSHREYLEDVFRASTELPSLDRILGEGSNPLWLLGPTADGAKALLEFWRQQDADSGELVHDFADPEWSTRFLGDLYQDLSQLARKRYALLQTPDFVESFILDRTLEPALEEFGLEETHLIDPACGSGHFLLGAFERIFARWTKKEPGTNAPTLAQRALDGVAGVDLNPFAVSIARFRLLLAALRVCGITRLSQAPGFDFHLAAGDSLLHGPAPSDNDEAKLNFYLARMNSLGHLGPVEDPQALRRILGRKYQAVVANPPYIVPKDKALNAAYRKIFKSCHRQYSLAVPFKERCFDLAASPGDGEPSGAGYVGLITANSFMKREFGKKLIEEFVPRWDLTHVIDTSGAYIPGHGTPTVILLARSRRPVAPTVRAVRGIRGEPSTPSDPALGKVWNAITGQVDRPGPDGVFVSTDDSPRIAFEKHPWSLRGGGAAELKESLERTCNRLLKDVVQEIGFGVVTREDEVFRVGQAAARRQGIGAEQIRLLIAGEEVRDWRVHDPVGAIWPYDVESLKAVAPEGLVRFLWPWRTRLSRRVAYGKSQLERGLGWHEYSMFFANRFRTPLTIGFAFVATHNHFVLDRGGKVFNRTAPVIKLAASATEDDHLALLGLLNSATGCFWMKQVFHCKGAQGVGEGLKAEPWEQFYEYDGTKLKPFPLPNHLPGTLARVMDGFSQECATLLASPPLDLARRRDEAQRLQLRVVALQEELDWQAYRLYGLLEDELCNQDVTTLPAVRLGERAFEIALAREVAAGEVETQWFARHGSTPVTEIPTHWPAAYRRLVQRRLDAIESTKSIRLIERPEYKRRWNTEPWEKQLEKASRSWLLNRLEDPRHWPEPRAVQSAAQLADRLHKDAEFQQVAALYGGQADFDLTALVTELCLSEAIPGQKALRYKATGLRKREAWEETWRLQRLEDALDARAALPEEDPAHLSANRLEAEKRKHVGTIPVPPKYGSGDYRQVTTWRMRGKLDVPKERFVLFPGAERDQDPTPVFGWAGWDHLQQAQAIAAYYLERKDQDGWSPTRLTPLLVALYELLPWLEQWHNEFDPTYGTGLGDYFRGFVDEEARSLELTTEALAAWEPPPELLKKKRKKAKKARATKKTKKNGGVKKEVTKTTKKTTRKKKVTEKSS
jgi:hypothetical protein